MVLRLWGKVLILCLGVSVVYINSFSGVFQFDDYKMIVNYARAHSVATWLYYFSYNIRPLLKLSYTLNWVSGAGLFGFHLFNLTIHILNTILIYFISFKFLSRKEYLPFINASFLAALLFGLHPIQTEAITYICGRSVSLMSLFYLGSMLAYITGTEKDKGISIYILSPLLFILAVFTRETAITLPLALLLWDIFNTEETGRLGKAFRRQAVHWMLLVIILVAFLLHLKYEQLFEFSFELRGIKENLLSQFNGLGYLLSRLVAVNSLNIDPDIPVFSAWTPSIIIKAILISSLLILSLITYRTKKWISFGILWLFLQLLPTNSIVPRLDIANERHMYLPAWGIFLIVAIGVEKLRTGYYEQRRLFHACILALLIVMGYFTWARNNIYRSEVALWEDTILRSPNKARCYNNLGFAYALEGRYEKAKEAYMRASDLDPDFRLAKNNLRKVESILEDDE